MKGSDSPCLSLGHPSPAGLPSRGLFSLTGLCFSLAGGISSKDGAHCWGHWDHSLPWDRDFGWEGGSEPPSLSHPFSWVGRGTQELSAAGSAWRVGPQSSLGWGRWSLWS